jgi:hypothetical protein
MGASKTALLVGVSLARFLAAVGIAFITMSAPRPG